MVATAVSWLVDSSSVEAMADSNHVLRVDGDAGDSLFVSDWGLWTYQGEAQVAGGPAKIYSATYNGQTVTVQFSSGINFTDTTVNTLHTNLQIGTFSTSLLDTTTAVTNWSVASTPSVSTAYSNNTSIAGTGGNDTINMKGMHYI